MFEINGAICYNDDKIESDKITTGLVENDDEDLQFCLVLSVWSFIMFSRAVWKYYNMI